MDENKLVQLFKDMLKDELKPIKEDIKDMNQNIKSLQSQVQENNQLIKALVHNSEVHKAEQDKIQNDIAHLKGDITHIKSTVEEIKKDLNNVEIITSSNWNDIAKLKAVK